MSHYSPMIAALVTMLLTVILLHSKAGKSVQDIPNERSLHSTPIPRIGGVGLMAGILSGWALIIKSLAWWVVLPMVFLFAISLLDDVLGLPVRKRLVAHFAAAVMVVLGAGVMSNPVIALLVLLAVVWMTNLYNFMDGSDGLSGGMAFFGFTIYGVALLMCGEDALAMLNFSVGAAALGFLYHNFHPAKVFMGDSGSIPLGFLGAAMGVEGWQHGCWPVWFPLLVFSPFVVDATVTLVKRSVRGAKVTEAHREHYYQRLIQLGVGHRNVALGAYALMLAVGVSALWGLKNPEGVWGVLSVWTLAYGLAMVWLDQRWKAKRHG